MAIVNDKSASLQAKTTAVSADPPSNRISTPAAPAKHPPSPNRISTPAAPAKHPPSPNRISTPAAPAKHPPSPNRRDSTPAVSAKRPPSPNRRDSTPAAQTKPPPASSRISTPPVPAKRPPSSNRTSTPAIPEKPPPSSNRTSTLAAPAKPIPTSNLISTSPVPTKTPPASNRTSTLAVPAKPSPDLISNSPARAKPSTSSNLFSTLSVPAKPSPTSNLSSTSAVQRNSRPSSELPSETYWGPPCRFVLAAMGFFCFFNLYALRVNISVALLSMVNTTHVKQMTAQQENATITTDADICASDSTNTSVLDGRFNWDSRQQGHILTIFFYGYTVTQLPGGLLSERYGGKLVLLLGIGFTAVLTLLTPVIVDTTGYVGLLIIRILEGIGEGVAYPAMHVMLADWVPPLERGRMATFIYSGSQIGTVVAMPLTGVLCQRVNWESAFYVFGGIGVVWSIMWIFLVYDAPSLHPRITLKEKTFIEISQGPRPAQRVRLKTPWLKIFTSPAVYAVTMGNFAQNWGNFLMTTFSPQFLSYILKFNIQNSGALAGAPYLTFFFGMLLGGVISDFMIARGVMTVTWVRKLFNFVGFGVSAVCLGGMGFVGCEKEVAVVLLLIIGFSLGLTWSGWGVNHLDLAPSFAGTLFGISNTVSAASGFLAPVIVGAFASKNQSRAAFRVAFFLSAAILVVCTIFFLIFGSAERQKWSYLPEETLPDEEAGAQVRRKSSTKSEESGSASVRRKSSTKSEESGRATQNRI